MGSVDVVNINFDLYNELFVIQLPMFPAPPLFEQIHSAMQ